MVSTAAMAWGNRIQASNPKTQADIACTHSACGGDERFLVERAEENGLGPGAPIGLHQRVRDVILSAKTSITGLAGGKLIPGIEERAAVDIELVQTHGWVWRRSSRQESTSPPGRPASSVSATGP
ncbi:hypothetical protein [Saccharopolyspora shandongensis]|uniref:hypothetical protein n=1 Tax=Saccharopolyspora shandongensis TaxID=418495 RepID=UPI0015A5ABB9|nr:hypothetical protein [Saccharopolyspora shandongensis]